MCIRDRVKSLRAGGVNLKDSWVDIEDGELLVKGMHITPYDHGNIFNQDPLRVRRLLAHKMCIRDRVKTKKGAHLVSSCFILDRDCGEEGLKRIAMGDCAVNIDYTDTVDKVTGEVKVSASAKLAEVAIETAKTAKLFGIDPKVAVLSFSTKGSGKGGTVALSHDAVIKAQEMEIGRAHV